MICRFSKGIGLCWRNKLLNFDPPSNNVFEGYRSFLRAVEPVPSPNKIFWKHRKFGYAYLSILELELSDLDIRCSGNMGNGGKWPSGSGFGYFKWNELVTKVFWEQNWSSGPRMWFNFLLKSLKFCRAPKSINLPGRLQKIRKLWFLLSPPSLRFRRLVSGGPFALIV